MQFDKTRMGEPFGHHHHSTLDKAHGRIEERRIDTLDATGDWFHEQHQGWPSVQSVIRITSHRTLGMDTTTEYRYYISSHPAEQDRLIASAIRAHWCVENNLHWCLDTAFNEDKSRIRKGQGPLNFAVFRRVVMTTLKKDKSKKKSLKVKRFLAALLPDYRMKLLGL
jgi:predicted transposase YbfD/YdcC